MSLTEDQLATFCAQGWLVLRGALSAERLRELSMGVDEVAEWAELGGPGLHHYEATEQGPLLARSEELVEAHAGLRDFIGGPLLLEAVGDLLGEPAVLYKEKVNYKQPAGAGFAPHQDAPAYRFVDHHISVMVPLDPATRESGGLWFAPGHQRGRLPEERGRIEPQVAETLAWQPVEAMPGDVVLFDSFAPHRSGTNTTSSPRRALYLTYNAVSKGDHRARYYADKRAEFAAAGEAFDGERARISVNDDFLGRAAERPRPRRRPLAELVERYAGPRAQQLYDEAVTELEHGLQCAALAVREGADEATVAAALLHDVGHLVIGDFFAIGEDLPRDFLHEEVGARYLMCFFGPEVTEPVRLHVAAKRYLVATEPGYAGRLTPSSLRSLQAQGSTMRADECAAFATLPGAQAALTVRRLDDTGKDPSLTVAPFAAYVPLLERLAQGTRRWLEE